MSSTKLTAVMILEVMGKPAEHLVETLEKMIESLSQEKGIKINEKVIHEPKEIEKKPGFFTTFSEIELEADDAFLLSHLMFKYMPSHFEVLEPEKFIFTNKEYSQILNELTRRLHGYDQIAQIIQVEKKILEDKLAEYEKK